MGKFTYSAAVIQIGLYEKSKVAVFREAVASYEEQKKTPRSRASLATSGTDPNFSTPEDAIAFQGSPPSWPHNAISPLEQSELADHFCLDSPVFVAGANKRPLIGELQYALGMQYSILRSRGGGGGPAAG